MDRELRVLISTGRFHPATALVRALRAGGAHVHVCDSYKLSPVLHSNAVEETHVVPPAAPDPRRFAEAVGELVQAERIDRVIPVFEEGFFLARYAELVPAPLFAPSFETAARLHNKLRFAELCGELGLQAPETVPARNRDELREAVGRFDEFVARPAFSRGGYLYLTNHGPRAGEVTVDDCQPTADNPWLVQPYVEGDDACSFSIVRDGHVAVHCVYEPTIAAPGGWAVQFESIDDFGTREITARMAAELDYNGFLSLDYRRTSDGVMMIECNPRISAGVQLTPQDWIGEAVLGAPPSETRTVPPGVRRQYDALMLEPGLMRLPPRQLIRELLTTPDALMKANDVLPALFLVISRRHWSKIARREHINVGRAFLEDIAWDGTPLDDPGD